MLCGFMYFYVTFIMYVVYYVNFIELQPRSMSIIAFNQLLLFY